MLNPRTQNIPVLSNPEGGDQKLFNRQNNVVIMQIWNRLTEIAQSVIVLESQMAKLLSRTDSIDCKTLTSDYTLRISDEFLEVDTSASIVIVYLIPLVEKRIVNIK